MIALPLIGLLLLGIAGNEENQGKTTWLEQRMTIGSLPTEVKKGALSKKKPQFTLEVPNYKKQEFGLLTERIPEARVQDGRLQFQGFPPYPIRGKAKKKYQKATFLMDYNEPVFAPLTKAVSDRHGARPTMDQLRLFVSEYINKKSFRRTFDIASKVAQTREGDCSEHAVLLVALARKYKYPSRLITGLVIADINGTFTAVGHAWVEYWQKGKWHLADAALPTPNSQESQLKVYGYLPLHLHDNEGPGYSASALSGGLNILHIKRIVIE